MDVIARRYGVRPSELLKSDPDDYQFDLFICSESMADEERRAKKRRPGGR